MNTHYVIIGGSAAGISCVEAIRGVDKKSKITLISEEGFPLYSRCLLSYFLAGTMSEDSLQFKEKAFFKKNGVEAILGVRAQALDIKAGKVTLDNKKKISFDRLLLATGARSKMLDIPGIGKRGVFALRTIKDAEGIEEALKTARGAVALGGGLIGLKAAYALKTRGIAVTVVVKSRQLMSQILDEKAASLIQNKVEEEGIVVIKGHDAKEVKGEGPVEGVILDDGSELKCGLVIVGKGVAPNTELAKGANIDVSGGIVVDEFLQTSERGVFAAGDVAETRDIASGEVTLNAIWPCAREQGKIAGWNMAGKKTKYDGSLGMNSVDFFGMPVISMGITRPKGEGYEEISSIDEKRGLYKKVVLKDDVIRGFISVGRIENAGVYNTLIRHEIDVGKIKDALVLKDFNYAKAMPLIKEYKERFPEEEFRDSIITY